MKKLVVLLCLLLAVESWGIYGAMQTEHITYTCTVKIGPLCYAWEANALGKVLGEKRALDLERRMREAREKLEKEFLGASLEKGKREGTEGLKAIIESAGDKAIEGLEKAKAAAAEALEGKKRDE